MGALEPATAGADAPFGDDGAGSPSHRRARGVLRRGWRQRRAPADSGERPGPGEAAAASPERTAEIYVLRHPAPAVLSNIVPIRPGALDALAREPAQSFPAESVELSRSERDAFREIARALVGHAPASRDDPADERTEADLAREVADLAEKSRRGSGRGRTLQTSVALPQGPRASRFSATPARFSTVCRSGCLSLATGARFTPTARCSISSAIPVSPNFRRRTGSPRYSATAIRKE